MTINSITQSKKVCQIEECPRKYYAKGFCKRHYEQFRMKGKIFGNPFYSHKDKNKFRVEGDTCRIELRDKRGHFKAFALINTIDLPLVEHYKWGVNKEDIVATRLDEKTMLSIWHLILGYPPKGREVDHINHNRLDNRRCNLRFATRLQNQSNLPMRSNSKTGFKGVHSHGKNGYYRARICHGGDETYLGVFEDKADAARAYNAAASEYFGEFACLNEIPNEQ